MNKFLMKIAFSSLCLIYLSAPLHAMKRAAEISEDEPAPKRQKTDADELISDTSEETSYILDLMYAFSEKLQKLACELGVNAPKERLAWLLTMNAILVRSQEVAWIAARDATGVLLDVAHPRIQIVNSELQIENFNLPNLPRTNANAKDQVSQEARVADLFMAKKAAHAIAEDIDKHSGWEVAKSPRLGTTLKLIIDAAKKKAQSELVNSFDGKKAYRVAEQAVLEAFLENFETIFNWTYSRVLYKLSLNNPSPLEDETALIECNRAHLAQSKPTPGQVCFLAPWFVHMQPLNIFLQPECSAFTRLRDDLYFYPIVRQLFICRKEADTSFFLCKELMLIIFENMIRLKVAKGNKVEK